MLPLPKPNPPMAALPPEGGSHTRTGGHATVKRRKRPAYGRVCSRLVLPVSTERTFGPCPREEAL